MNSTGNSNAPLGGAGHLHGAANAPVNQPQEHFTTSLVSGVHYSVGPSDGSSEKKICLEDCEKRVTHLFAKVIEPSDIDEQLKNVVLRRGCAVDCQYLPLKLDVLEGGQIKQQILLVRVEHICDAMKKFSNQPDIRKGDVLAPSSVLEFLEKHGASDEDFDAAVSALLNAGDQVAAGTPSDSIINRQWLFEQMSDAALFFTIKALNLSDEQVKTIGYIAKSYKKSEEYLEFAEKQKSTPGSNEFYAYHIRAGAPVTIDGKVYATPLSLLMNPAAPEGMLDVEVLLKGKIPDYALRARGSFKSVKTTIHLATGRIRVQCTFNVGLQAKELLRFRDDDGTFWEESTMSAEEVTKLRDMENELIGRYMSEADLQYEFSGIETEKPGIYAASPTRDSQVDLRLTERKFIREGGELLLTYTMEEALGDLANASLRKTKILGSTNVQEIARPFYNCLLDTAMTLEKLHAKNRVHRDLKMENMLLFSEKKEDRVKVSDYGFSIEVNPNGTAKNDEAAAGTMMSMDPDTFAARIRFFSLTYRLFSGDDLLLNRAREAEGLKSLDLKKGDVFGLGCTYYALLMSKGTTDDKTAWTPFGAEMEKVFRVFIDCQNKKNQGTLVKEDTKALSKRIEEVQDLAKTLPLMEEARNNLMKVCPPEVANLIASMLHPDAKVRPDMMQVVSGIKRLEGLVK